MARFADRVVAESVKLPFWIPSVTPSTPIEEGNVSLRNLLRSQLPVIVADNVSVWMGKRDFNVYQFAPVAPPFNSFWMEWRPRYEGGDEKPAVLHWDRVGALVATAPPATHDMIRRKPWRNVDHNAVEWYLDVCLYAEDRRSGPIGPIVWWTIAVDKLGRNLETLTTIPDVEGSNIVVDQSGSGYDPYLLVPLQTIMFMHCKNVTTEQVEIAEKVDRKYRKRTGQRLLRYRMIKISPLKEKVRHASGEPSSGTGIAPSVHIVPGHFAYYGMTNPLTGKDNAGLLFGKYQGQFWIPDHVRGNAEHGAVVHDYEVEVDANAQPNQRAS